MIFNGKKEADKILSVLKKKIKKERARPGLAVILIGNNSASKLYIKLKKKAAKKVGISFSEYRFSEKTKEETIIEKIKQLNDDKAVSGIIVQLPLQKRFDSRKIIKAISVKKDIDGFISSKFQPVLPLAIFLALQEASKRGRNAIALVNSDIFGKTLQKFLKKRGVSISYTLDRKKSLKNYDIVITACGKPKFIKGYMIKKGAILIDVGITRFLNGKVVGDVDKESVKDKASFLTPVPGGIGPLTVALLLKNTHLAYGSR